MFVTLGPAFGAFVALAASWPLHPPSWAEVALMPLYLWLIGIFFGGVPALGTGVIAAALAPRVTAKLLYVALCTASGAVLSTAHAVVRFRAFEGDSILLGGILPGAAAALVCAAATLPASSGVRAPTGT